MTHTFNSAFGRQRQRQMALHDFEASPVYTANFWPSKTTYIPWILSPKTTSQGPSHPSLSLAPLLGPYPNPVVFCHSGVGHTSQNRTGEWPGKTTLFPRSCIPRPFPQSTSSPLNAAPTPAGLCPQPQGNICYSSTSCTSQNKYKPHQLDQATAGRCRLH